MKQTTIEKYLKILNHVFESSKTRKINAKSFNKKVKGVDPYFAKLMRDKGLVKVYGHTRDRYYKWDSIRPTRDMATALLRECNDYNIARKNKYANKTTSKPIAIKTKVTPKDNKPKSKVSILWGLYTKVTY